MARILLSGQLDAARAAVESAGHRVLECPEDQLVERARELRPDAIVLGVSASGADAYRRCGQLRADASLRDLPILLFATEGGALDPREASRCGADEVFSGPQAAENLRRCLEAHLGLAGLREELRAANRALEARVEERTAELRAANAALRAEVERREGAERELRLANTVLQTVQDASLDGILVVDPRGGVLRANPRFLEIWRLDPQALASGSAEQTRRLLAGRVVRPEDFLDRIDYLTAHPEKSSHDELELKDGRAIDRFSAPMAAGEGPALGRVWFFRDVTDRKLAEMALRESELRLRRIVETAREGIWVLGPDERTTSVNRRMAELLGTTRDELLERPFTDFLFEEDLAEHRRRMDRRREGVSEQFEGRLRHRSGEPVSVIVSATPLEDSERRYSGSFAMFTDITARVRTERALAEERRLFVEGPTVVFRWRNAPGWPVEYVSPNVEKELGYPRERFGPGLSDYASLVHPDDLVRVADEVGRYSAEGRDRFQQVYRLRRADGEFRWVDDYTTVIRDCKGAITHYHGYVLDITDRERAEEALEQSEQKLRAVVLGSPTPQFVIDQRHRVLYWNRALEQLTGVHAEEVVGGERHWSAFYPTPHPTLADLLVDHPAETVSSWQGIPVRRAPRAPHALSGTGRFRLGEAERWLTLTAVPIQDARGRTIGAAETIEDVTERQRAEEEREARLAAERAARHEAERIARAKDEFLATLSHEVRTPLTSILGWSQLLRSKPAARPDLERGLETIERNARAQARLIDDLLDMSRILSGLLRLEIQPVDLSAVIDAALAAVRPAALAKGLRLERRLVRSERPILADPDRLRQIVWNLLANAVKFTPRGGRVRVSAHEREGELQIAVEDTGIGIRPEFLPHLFERFRQEDSSNTRLYGGIGLGLAIVRHLAEMHGGTVEASSPGTGQGASFRVRLPLEPRRADEEPAAAAAEAEAEADLRGLRVLVVDGEPESCELIGRMLEEYGARVECAGSATEALERFERGPPQVLVSALDLPGEDGLALIRRIRALPAERGGRTPALALTVLAAPEDRARARAAGFGEHLAKPVEPATLAAHVAALARGAPGAHPPAEDRAGAP